MHLVRHLRSAHPYHGMDSRSATGVQLGLYSQQTTQTEPSRRFTHRGVRTEVAVSDGLWAAVLAAVVGVLSALTG